MKKLTIGLVVLFSGMAGNSYAAVSAGVSPFCVTVPSLCGGFNIGVTGNWFRGSTPHDDYALTYPPFIRDDTALLPLITPLDEILFVDGRYHNVDLDHHWGYKINVGYVIPCTGNDINLAYTHWDHDDSDHVVRPDGVILPTLTNDFLQGAILFPVEDNIVFFPNTEFEFYLDDILDYAYFYDYIVGIPINSAEAHSDLKYHAWDLDFGQYISIGCNMRMRLFAGVRWAEIDHHLNARYAGALSNMDITDILDVDDISSASLSMEAAINIRSRSDFDGVGPRFGTNIAYNFGGGFGIVGEASAALLVGELNSGFRESRHYAATLNIVTVDGDALSDTITIDPLEENYHHPDETRVVPNLEGKLGLDYTYVFCNRSKLSIEAGYMVTHYFNSNERLSTIGIDAPEFRTRHTIDTSFEGPYVTIQYQL